MNAYKSASRWMLKKEFPQIKKKLWKETFWNQSAATDGRRSLYFLCATKVMRARHAEIKTHENTLRILYTDCYFDMILNELLSVLL